MKKLLHNFTIREVLLVTLVVALSLGWWLQRDEHQMFLNAYSKMQSRIRQYEQQKASLENLELDLANTDDVLEVVRRHNMTIGSVRCELYYDSRRKCWRAFVRNIPRGGRYQGKSGSAAEALRLATAEYDEAAQARILQGIRDAIGTPSKIDFDEGTNTLHIEVPIDSSSDSVGSAR